MRKSQLKPWLNEDGSVKSDAKIRKAGQQWPPGVWEAYLSTLEVGRREEVVLSPAEMDTFSSEEYAGMLLSMSSKKKFRLLKFALKASIHTLSPRQREVIVSHYWGGKTVAEIAVSMGISEQSVRKNIRTSLSKLRACLTSSSLMKQVMHVKKMMAA